MCKEFLAIIDKLDCQKRETVDRQFEESNKKVDECKFKIEESNRKLEECHKKVEESKCIVEQSNKKVDECCKRLEQCNKIVEELKVKSSGKGEMPIKVSPESIIIIYINPTVGHRPPLSVRSPGLYVPQGPSVVFHA